MSDEETKQKLAKAARAKLAAQLMPALADPANRLRTAVAIKVLAIVDREIGKGEPRVESDWSKLKEMVAGQEGASELVSNLQASVQTYGDELRAKIAAGEADEKTARAAALKVIRVALLRKIQLAAPTAKA